MLILKSPGIPWDFGEAASFSKPETAPRWQPVWPKSMARGPKELGHAKHPGGHMWADFKS